MVEDCTNFLSGIYYILVIHIYNNIKISEGIRHIYLTYHLDF